MRARDRAARWLDRTFSTGEVPVAVEETFARGGRNLQRIRSERAEHQSAVSWRSVG